MSVADVIARPFSPLGRWVFRRLQWVEHGYERARASERADGDTRLRIFFVLALFGAGFVALGLGAARAALFSPYGHGVVLAPSAADARAELTDRNGAVLALDVPRFGLYVDPHEMAFPDRVQAALVKALPGLPADKLARLLASGQQQYVVGDLTPQTRDAIHDLALPGVTFEEETGRDYPLHAFAAHLIGYSRDGNGVTGAERAFNGALRADGGADPMALSIDLRVQGALENELDKAVADMSPDDAVGLVVNVRTGEILAMASWPTYDPNQVAGFNRQTMTNRAAGQVYEPGSVMKIFTLAMGLDAGLATPDTTFDVGAPLQLEGQTIHDFDHGPGVLTLREVFTHSSNIGAAQLGLMAGPDRMDHYFRSFGLFNAAPSELIESTRPILPQRLTPNAVASMAFGHAIAVTPLQLAAGFSAIFDGGVYRPLTLRPLSPGQPPAAGVRVIQESTSTAMLALMRDNVVEGTGTQADELGLRVGGKTGTATKLVDGRYAEGRNAANLASFAAIFPTDGPLGADRYLVLIMLDAPKPSPANHGVTTAAFSAAPVAGRVIERIAPFLGVGRVITAADLAPRPPSTLATSGAAER